jgi:MATE family multidrug resistance protein
LQAYGAKNYKALGEILQRAVLICWTISIPVLCIWTQAESVLLALGQDPTIATAASRCGWPAAAKRCPSSSPR